MGKYEIDRMIYCYSGISLDESCRFVAYTPNPQATDADLCYTRLAVKIVTRKSY